MPGRAHRSVPFCCLWGQMGVGGGGGLSGGKSLHCELMVQRGAAN